MDDNQIKQLLGDIDRNTSTPLRQIDVTLLRKLAKQRIRKSAVGALLSLMFVFFTASVTWNWANRQVVENIADSTIVDEAATNSDSVKELLLQAKYLRQQVQLELAKSRAQRRRQQVERDFDEVSIGNLAWASFLLDDGDTEGARAALSRIVDEYPNGFASRLAADRLTQLEAKAGTTENEPTKEAEYADA